MGDRYLKILPAFALSFSVAVFADCNEELDRFAPALTNDSTAHFAPKVIDEAVRLFDEAISYCTANREAEALQRIAEARALLGLPQ
jgi:hypothetical protein